MKKKIIIGKKEFNFKKDALKYYKNILNSYEFGEALNSDDFKDVFDLLKMHERADEKIGSGIKMIKVDEVRYRTKCFHLIREDETIDIFSYTKCINGRYSPQTKFARTCREAINDDLRKVKLAYFKRLSKKGQVKCQETGELCVWEELNVDHRQPNTFSIIVDRFIEVNEIDVKRVAYKEIVDAVYEFENEELKEKFKNYHKGKANLRIVKKGKNLGRSFQARVKQQKKDLKIE